MLAHGDSNLSHLFNLMTFLGLNLSDSKQAGTPTTHLSLPVLNTIAVSLVNTIRFNKPLEHAGGSHDVNLKTKTKTKTKKMYNNIV